MTIPENFMITLKKTNSYINKNNSKNNNNNSSRSLDLNNYYNEHHKNYDSNLKGQGKDYAGAVGNSITRDISKIYGLSQSDSSYDSQLEDIYKQIVKNNHSLFAAKCNDTDSLSIEKINEILADLSWDGKNNDIIALPDNIKPDNDDKYELNLNSYYKDNTYKHGKDKADKEYYDAVEDAIEKTIAECFEIDKNDSNYENQMQEVYKQIAENNNLMLNDIKLTSDSTKEEISEALAKYSWDGKKDNDIISIPNLIELKPNEEIEEAKEIEEDNKDNKIDTNTDTNNTKDTHTTVEPTKEQKEFQNTLARASEKEADVIVKNNTAYHVDKDGKVLYTQTTGSTIPPATPNATESNIYLAAIDNNSKLDLNKYCSQFKNEYKTEQKGKGYNYKLAVSGAILNTLSQNLGINTTNYLGNYSNEMKAAYSKIVSNNKELFAKYNYNFDENTTINEINAAMADLSWDGESNDLIDLSGITPESINEYCNNHKTNITILYDYDGDNLVSTTEVSLNNPEKEIKDITKCSPEEYTVLNKTTYSKLGDENDYVIQVEKQDYVSNTTTESQINEDDFKTKEEFIQQLQQAKISVSKIESDWNNIYYYDKDGKLLYTSSKTGDNIFIEKKPVEANEENGLIVIHDENNNTVTVGEGETSVQAGNNSNYVYDKNNDSWYLSNKQRGFEVTLYQYDNNGNLSGSINAGAPCYKKEDIISQSPDSIILKSASNVETDNKTKGTTTTYTYYDEYGNKEEYVNTKSKEEIERTECYANILNNPITNTEQLLSTDNKTVAIGNHVFEYENGRISKIIDLSKSIYFKGEGNTNRIFNTIDYNISQERTIEYNETGNLVTITSYNADGTIKEEYDTDGNKIDNPKTYDISSDNIVSVDSVQGGIGDCYGISTRYGTDSTPIGKAKAESMVTQNTNGDYQVSMYNKSGKQETYIVSQDKAINAVVAGILGYSPRGYGDIDWVIFEYAFEQLRNKENKDLYGGYMHEITQAMFGKESSIINSDNKSLDWIRKNGENIGKGNLVADFYVYGTSGHDTMCYDVNGDLIDLFGGSSYIAIVNGKYSGHSLSIVGYDKTKDTVTLRNTHGEGTYEIAVDNLKNINIGVEYLDLAEI